MTTICSRSVGDRAVMAAYRRAMMRVGREITVLRITGQAPRTALISATVNAIAADALPDTRDESRTGYGASEVGGISQTMRRLVVLEEDLRRERFPLPLAKNDKVVLVEGGDRLNIVDVDAAKRRLGGGIEIQVAGVA